ncbi:MAG: SAM-dependent methyltransferase PA0798 (UbiE paralog) [uncultured Nocardioidaceae bacterium]|uniref:SAM-dependent methyltransferase PA0798 (UbiE paralog) n=1 Tax=uncultured Nocardioidaceae bacterium TaxID=253824 RepID=A0A6J4LA93_9ACTN|nr:MAG: SAM-dependent methyltransferase PA0798 (UbiE paralog) [uncultured Nocardioidaceae bacterium]
MGWWERHGVPRMVEASLGTEQVHELRAETCRPLDGRVLEVGFGSGLNVDHYPAAVTEVAAVEPNETAWRLAAPRLARSAVPVLRSGLDGQRLDEPDDSFDHVLLTFVLCTVPDQVGALSEARRVLRSGGVVHFLEHGLAPDAPVQRWQRRLEPVQKRIGGGCHLTRDPVADLGSAALEVEQLTTFYAPGPAVSRPWAHVYQGTARKIG